MSCWASCMSFHMGSSHLQVQMWQLFLYASCPNLFLWQNLHWKSCHGSACALSLSELLCDLANHTSDTLLGLPTSGLDVSQKLWMYGSIPLTSWSHNTSWMGIIYFKVTGRYSGLLQDANITSLAASSSSHQAITTSGWPHHLQQWLEYDLMIPEVTLSLLHSFHSLSDFSSFCAC